MRSILSITLLFFFFLYTYAQPKDRIFIENDGDTILLGQITSKRLEEKPFSVWFNEGKAWEGWAADTMQMNRLLFNQVDSIVVFMGTWCGDSHREVPRFYSILKYIGFDLVNLNIVAVDHTYDNYKQSPGREDEGKNIHRVPTFIFLDSAGSEINRIVESPVHSWSTDLYQILNENLYRPNYLAIPWIDSLLTSVGWKESIQKNHIGHLNVLRTLSESPYELYTYARKLIAEDRFFCAEWVLSCNTALYPMWEHSMLLKIRLMLQQGKLHEVINLISSLDLENNQYKERYLSLKHEAALGLGLGLPYD